MPIQYIDSFTATTATDTSTSISVTTTSADVQFQVALIVTNERTDASTPDVITPPSGWTNLTAYGGGNGSNRETAVLSYNAPNTLPSSGTFTWTFGIASRAIIILSRYADITVLKTASGQRTLIPTLYTAQVNPGVGQRLVICGFAQRASITMSNFELRQTGTVGGQASATLVGSMTSRAAQTTSFSGTQFTNMVGYLADTVVATTSTLYNGQATSPSTQEGAGLIATFGFEPGRSSIPSIF